MNILDLFDIDDMCNEVINYLNFEDKVTLSKIINKNCLRKYNFNSNSFRYKNIEDIFTYYKEEDDDIFCDYMSELQSIFNSELDQYYDDYYGYDNEDYMNDYYNNISYQKHRDLTELFYSSYWSVYARHLAEHIEDNNLPMIYYDYDIFEIDEKMDTDIHDTIIGYYKYAFEYEDIDILCKKCGLFGHHSASNECIFYNVYYEKRLIKKTVKETLSNMVNKVIEIDFDEKKRLKRLPLLCFVCKENNKKNKCTNNCCGKCCSGCIIHKK